MTTAEQLAIAVLKGDKDAIRVLMDNLQEDYAPNGEAKELPPIKKITVPIYRLRVIVYVKEGYNVDGRTTVTEVMRWLSGQLTLIGNGIDRVEIYELPEGFIPTRQQEEEMYPARVMEYTPDTDNEPHTTPFNQDIERTRVLLRENRRTLCSNGCCFECSECNSKPGSPTLCPSCLNRRALCNNGRRKRPLTNEEIKSIVGLDDSIDNHDNGGD